MFLQPIMLEEINATGAVIQKTSFLPLEYFAQNIIDSSGNRGVRITSFPPLNVSPT